MVNVRKRQLVLVLALIVVLVCLSEEIIAEAIPPLPYVYESAIPKPNLELKLNDIFDVDPFYGSADYFYPIKVPKGTNGLNPKLFVFYNSYLTTWEKPSILGAGWAITNNYIQRNVNYSFEDYTDDKFELFLDGSFYELTYVPNENVFHTKDESFFYISNLSGGNNTNDEYWVLKTKDGIEYRFGYNQDSELVSNIQSYTIRWSLDLVNDTFGNKIYYNYLENPHTNDSGAVYLSNITYNNDKKRKIELIYETSDRPDLREVYEEGNKIIQSRRLNTINITSEDDAVRKYVFEYQTLENYLNSLSSLSNITEYGTDGTSSLPATKFSYWGVNSGWNPETAWKSPDCFVNPSGEDNGLRLVDVNGDGLTDLLRAKEDSSGNCIYYGDERAAWLNNGSDWIQNDSWKSPACFVSKARIDMGLRLSDVNGDGLPDILKGKEEVVTNRCGDDQRTAWLNTGSGWVQNDSWQPPICFVEAGRSDNGYRLSDVNGDGLPDILYGEEDVSTGYCHNDQRTAWLNTGSGWVQNDSWQPPTCFIEYGGEDRGVRITDVNGDGLPDILFGKDDTITSYCWPDDKTAWLNTGSGWVQNDSWQPPICFLDYSGSDRGVRITDVNGDGLPDILYGEEEVVTHYCNDDQKAAWLNTGSGWVQNDSWQPPICFIDDSGDDDGLRLVDVNGDGISDILRAKDDSSGDCVFYGDERAVWINNASSVYLLKEIATSLGGKISIDYKKSTYLDNTGNNSQSDLGFNLWVVANITHDNGLDGSNSVISITEYNYSGGKYEYYPKNEFRGFNYAEEKTGGKKTKRWFYQDDGNQGKEYETQVLDVNANLYYKKESTWNTIEQDGYYITLLLEESESYYDNMSANPRIKNTSYSYDIFGNVIKKHYKGDVSNANDDKYEYYNYLNNSNLWIVNKLKNYSLFDYDDSTKLKGSLFTYDNLNYGQFPIKGGLTSKEDWLSTEDNPVTNYSYDDYGNKINKTDANGHITTYVYGIRDSTHTFVDRIINAKGHITDYNYHLGTGNLLWKIDSNGYITNYTYDVFGRIEKEILPYDSISYPTKEYEYTLDGIAPEKIKVMEREASGTSNTFDRYYFYDGFGRLVQSKKESENSKQIVNDIYYDELGRADRQTNPYFADYYSNYSTPNTTIKTTNYTYDALDRITQVINPDDTQISLIHQHWNTTLYDENGHRKEYAKDAYDQVIQVREYNNDSTYYTLYEYDAIGNLVEIQDSLGNIFNYTYDSLGRKISMNDPDLGIWDYSYDAVGNLLEQTDNLDNITYFEYDELDRVTKKSSSDENITYFYDLDKNNTLTQVQNGWEIINYTYDNRLRKIQEDKFIDNLKFTLRWAYDSLNRKTSETLPDESSINYTYDNQGKMGSIIDILNISYNEKDKPINKEYENGLETNYTYDADNFRLLNIRTGNKQDLNYGYDNVGNIVLIDDTVNNKTDVLQYDSLDRLTNANRTNNYSINYYYDSIGNLLLINFGNYDITFNYGLVPLHAPISYFDSSTYIPLLDPYKFFIKDPSGNNVTWFGDTGNIVLKGSCILNTTCIPPANSFIIKNPNNDSVAYIDSEGNLCLTSGSCNDRYTNCDNPGDGSFIIRNETDINVAFINSTGSLCLIGDLLENEDI